MKYFYGNLKSGQIAPVYLFYGEESLLMDEALAALARAILPTDDGWSRELLDGEQTDPAEAAAAAAAGNFFGGRRLVIVKGINWLESGKATRKAAGSKEEGGKSAKGAPDQTAPLVSYLADPNPDTCLVLTMYNSPDKRRKLVQAIQKKGRLVAFTTPKGGETEIWLAQRLQAQGKKAQKQALHYLSLSAANLSQMAMELDKLCLYVGERAEITLADAQAVVSKSSIFSIFELTDAAAEKNAARAVAAYHNLLTQGEEEQKIFVMLANQFRNMLAVQDMLAQGYHGADLAGTLGLHPYVAEKCSRQARSFSRAQLIKTLEMLLAADIAQKSGSGDMQSLLETVILRICAFI